MNCPTIHTTYCRHQQITSTRQPCFTSSRTPVIVKTVVEKLGLIVSVYWEIRHELADARIDIDLQVADTA